MEEDGRRIRTASSDYGLSSRILVREDSSDQRTDERPELQGSRYSVYTQFQRFLQLYN